MMCGVEWNVRFECGIKAIESNSEKWKSNSWHVFLLSKNRGYWTNRTRTWKNNTNTHTHTYKRTVNERNKREFFVQQTFFDLFNVLLTFIWIIRESARYIHIVLKNNDNRIFWCWTCKQLTGYSGFISTLKRSSNKQQKITSFDQTRDKFQCGNRIVYTGRDKKNNQNQQNNKHSIEHCSSHYRPLILT